MSEVSILVLVDEALEVLTVCVSGANRVVSILVLVDEALEDGLLWSAYFSGLFQSLFSWMKRSKIYTSESHDTRPCVSILVLVDEALEAAAASDNIQAFTVSILVLVDEALEENQLSGPPHAQSGFNPCSRG